MEINKKYDLSVLVVEDDLPSKMFMSSLLKLKFREIFSADNGLSGLEQYNANKPDIIIADIGMPVMDGLELSRRIKAINPKAHIILTTAFDQKSYMLEAIRIGIDQYILKPLQKDQLYTSIERVAGIILLEKEVESQYENIIRLSLAVDQSPNMVVMVEKSGTVQYVNKKFCDTSLLDRDEVIGKHIDELNLFEKRIGDFEEVKFMLKENQSSLKSEFSLTRHDGSDFWVDISVTPVVSHDGTTKNYVVQLEDITERKRVQEQLKQYNEVLEEKVKERTMELQSANEALKSEIEIRKRTENELIQAKDIAETANKTKSSFLAKVSHELRTPMNGILGITSVMLSADIDEKNRKYLSMVKVSADNLMRIINDILDISKIEAGKLSLSPTVFKLHELIEHTLDLFRINIKNKGLDLFIDIANNIPENLFGDPIRLQQIIVNLMGNSMKFTDQGHISLSVKKHTEHSGNIELLFSIVDTGIGIAPEKIGDLFQSFSQLEGHFTRKYGGTGLGLAISKELVELMGGKIWVESSPKQGSNFSFTVRMKVDTSGSTDEPEEEPLSLKELANQYDIPHLNILVAEDSLINQEVLKQVLIVKNFDVVMVSNGLEALEVSDSTDFDLIFMDVQMPEMDGIEATKKIRQRENDRSLERIPIIGLTAHEHEANIQECLDSGMDSCISKPFDWHTVFDMLLKYSKRNTATENPIVSKLRNLLYLLNGNKKTLKYLIDFYQTNYIEELNDLNNSIEEKNFRLIQQLSHKIKSEIGNFGSETGMEYASRIEKASKEKKLANIKEYYSKLKEEMTLLGEGLMNIDIDSL